MSVVIQLILNANMLNVRMTAAWFHIRTVALLDQQKELAPIFNNRT